MPTLNQQKVSDFKKWISTSEIQLSDFSNYTQAEGQNYLRQAIQKTSKTIGSFKKNFSWWKHDIKEEDLHHAESLCKRLTALHSKLELEYKKKD